MFNFAKDDPGQGCYWITLFGRAIHFGRWFVHVEKD